MAGNQVKVTVDDRALIALIAELEKQGKPTRIVADGTNYGIYVEFGTVKMGKRPFLGPALAANKKNLDKGLKSAGDDMSGIGKVLDKVAFDVLRDARAAVPVDTGNLKASLHVVDPEKESSEYEAPR